MENKPILKEDLETYIQKRVKELGFIKQAGEEISHKIFHSLAEKENLVDIYEIGYIGTEQTNYYYDCYEVNYHELTENLKIKKAGIEIYIDEQLGTNEKIISQIDKDFEDLDIGNLTLQIAERLGKTLINDTEKYSQLQNILIELRNLLTT